MVVLEPGGGPLALCELVGAQLGRVAELAGGKDAEVTHASCRSRGQGECRFVVTWAAGG